MSILKSLKVNIFNHEKPAIQQFEFKRVGIDLLKTNIFPENFIASFVDINFLFNQLTVTNQT